MSLHKYTVGDNVVIWRYMDLSKLLDILVHRQLVFPRLDQFEDVYEGHPSKFLEALSYAFSDPESQGMRKLVENGVKTCFKLIKVRGYVSCWHMNDNESAGMWKLYCKTNESLVIKTKVGRLKRSLTNPKNEFVNRIEVGQVDYKNNTEELKEKFIELSRNKERIDISYPDIIFSKRSSFEHEKEIRIIACNENKIQDPENQHKSVSELKSTTPVLQKIECNVEEMIEEIIIAPDAPQWFVHLVKNIVAKLGYSFPISQSELYTLK
ncbi:DUF2971 domain-containing protein [Acinetobacter sp.]|uniref:DUF2971 domain-containing protein n=2 Tax=Acinetobacter sp. TaxID=472 RepID=UPI002FC660A9